MPRKAASRAPDSEADGGGESFPFWVLDLHAVAASWCLFNELLRENTDPQRSQRYLRSAWVMVSM